MGSKAKSLSAQSKKVERGLAAGIPSSGKTPPGAPPAAEGLGMEWVWGTSSGRRDAKWWWFEQGIAAGEGINAPEEGEAGGGALNGETGKEGHRRCSTCSCMERAGERGCSHEASCGKSDERLGHSSGIDGEGWGDGYTCLCWRWGCCRYGEADRGGCWC